MSVDRETTGNADYERDPNSAMNSIYAEAAALRRIARALLRQVKRGAPSNFEQVAGHYLDAEDLPVFRDLVADGDEATS